MTDTTSHSWQDGNLILHIYIQPNAAQDAYAGEFNGRIKLKIKAPAVDGKANRQLLLFLSATFGVKQGAVRLLHGDTARYKKIEIQQPQTLPAWIAPPAERVKRSVAQRATHD
jgi:uncharacterized protein (TIGR00251 family)